MMTIYWLCLKLFILFYILSIWVDPFERIEYQDKQTDRERERKPADLSILLPLSVFTTVIKLGICHERMSNRLISADFSIDRSCSEMKWNGMKKKKTKTAIVCDCIAAAYGSSIDKISTKATKYRYDLRCIQWFISLLC